MSVSTPPALARFLASRGAGGGPLSRRLAGPPAREGPLALGAALALAVAYAAFSSGATDIPDLATLVVGLAAVAVAALAVLLFGRALRLPDDPLALAGLTLLVAFAAWSGLSLGWSITPDLSWTELNRGLAYALVAALAMVLGASLPRAPERVAGAYLAIATGVALYALGGKVAPWLLNHTADFSRLRAPLGYWNALAIFCVLAAPLAVARAADAERPARGRLAAALALMLLLVATALTYSRGGLLALVAALAVLVAASPERPRMVAFAAVGVAGAVPALFVAFLREDLTTDGLSVAARTDDGLLLLAALVVGAVAVILAGRWLVRADPTGSLGERGRRRALRTGLAAGGAVLLILIVGLAASGRGLVGTVSDQFTGFTTLKADPRSDPSRILRTNSGNRWVWWKEAAGAFWDRPLHGHGAGSFPALHERYREEPLNVRQAHSVPLQFLAETGVLGALLALGGLALLGLAALVRIRAAAGSERRYSLALGASALAWGVHMWVDWDWNIPGVTLPLLVFLGVLAVRPPSDEEGAGAAARLAGSGLPPSARAVLLGFGTLFACAIAISALLPSLARDRTNEALELAGAAGSPDLAGAARKAETARRLNPLAVEPDFAAATIAQRRRDFRHVGALLVDAVERQPSNPETWLRLARFQLQLDDAAGASRSAAVAVQLDALSFPARIIVTSFDLHARSATATGTPLPKNPLPVPAFPAPARAVTGGP